METLKAVLSMCLALMIVVSLYVGGALLGYVLAALGVIIAILLVGAGITTGLAIFIRQVLFTSKKKRPPL